MLDLLLLDRINGAVVQKIVLIFFFAFGSCASISQETHNDKKWGHSRSSKGSEILRVGDIMVKNKEVIRGGCWDYIDTIYKRAGFSRKKRKYIFRGDKNHPPYAPTRLIKSGDWLYYVNYSYHKIEHSGIFVRWIDKAKKRALVLSYAGEYRKKPGRYKIYNISKTYTIIRGSK